MGKRKQDISDKPTQTLILSITPNHKVFVICLHTYLDDRCYDVQFHSGDWSGRLLPRAICFGQRVADHIINELTHVGFIHCQSHHGEGLVLDAPVL